MNRTQPEDELLNPYRPPGGIDDRDYRFAPQTATDTVYERCYDALFHFMFVIAPCLVLIGFGLSVVLHPWGARPFPVRAETLIALLFVSAGVPFGIFVLREKRSKKCMD